MEAHPKLSFVKTVLIMIPLLFGASCASDRPLLKPEKELSIKAPIEEGLEENLSKFPSEEGDLTPVKQETEGTVVSPAEIEGEEKAVHLLKDQEEHPDYPNAQVTNRATISTLPEINDANNGSTSLESEKGGQLSLSANNEEVQSIPPSEKADEEKPVTSSPGISQEQQAATLLIIEKDTPVSYPPKHEEEKAVPSVDIEGDQPAAILPQTRGKRIIPAIEKSETCEQGTASKGLEVGEENTPSLKTGEEKVVIIPAENEGAHKVAPMGKMDENETDTTSDPTRGGQKEPAPLDGEREEGQQIATLPNAAFPQVTDQQVLPSDEISEEEKVLTPAEIENPLPPSGDTQQKSDQELLDSALEFCQASYDFWEQGDLNNALDALDQAYSLILKVNPEKEPELLQQKEDLRFTISKRIIEVYSSRFTVANGHNSVIPLVMNRYVERALTLFKGRERKFFLDAYRLSGQYRPTILKALKEAGLPEELSWLPFIESGFKIRALSRSRALGLWQFIASTGYKYGLKRDTWVDERMDPEKSTAAAIAYLRELHQIFGDWTTALAAYNCGEGKVLECIRTQRINYLDNFWDLYERLPVETAFYVPKLMAVLHILNDPETHGFTLPPVDEEIEAEAVTIDKQVHLETIAENLDISYSLLKSLNPALRYNYTPNRPYSLKVPKGKRAVLLSKLNDIHVSSPPVSAYFLHKVRKGESLSFIARRYGTSVRAIMVLNGLIRSHYIRTGWNLKIPTKRIYASPAKVSSAAQSSQVRRELTAYVVQKGDSLWRIADRFGTTTKSIQALNKLHDTHLRIGQELLIPQDLTTGEQIKTRSYVVLKGDSPYQIAKEHHMELSQFLRINNLSPRSTIFPGQVLHVKEE
jgi:membrane-bound lytic murein transglycosylase D